jgi:thiol-disulfide isomerase/thioredoxin
MDKTIRIVGVVLAVVLLGAALVFAAPLLNPSKISSVPDQPVSGKVVVYFFYGEECPHCHEVRPFIDNLSQKYSDVDFRMLETWHNETNNALSVSLNRQLGVTDYGVPEVIVGNTVLVGSRDIPAKLEAAILEQKKKI